MNKTISTISKKLFRAIITESQTSLNEYTIHKKDFYTKMCTMQNSCCQQFFPLFHRHAINLALIIKKIKDGKYLQ